MRVKLLDPKAKAPVVEHPAQDLGYDLFSLEDVTLRCSTVQKVRTGICIEFDEFWGGLIRDRSSLAAKGVTVSGGVIDSGYRGEIIVLMTYHNESVYKEYEISEGDKIAQIMPLQVHTWKTIQIVKELTGSTRGIRGFGSSGK
jgi:dUTP pyrophosphatase